jgi:protein gp37
MTSYKISETFSTLFPPRPHVLEAIQEHMEQYGYDPAYPIILGDGDWTDNVVLIDGHTRAAAAKNLGINAPFVIRDFTTEDDALEYAIHCQRDRRNLTDGEIARCYSVVLDSRKQRGQHTGNQYTRLEKAQGCANSNDTPEDVAPDADLVTDLEVMDSYRPKLASNQAVVETNSVVKILDQGKTAEKMAKILGVSTRKVEQLRTVMKEAPEEIKEEVLSDKKSINKAYTEVQEIKKQREEVRDVSTGSKSTFNSTNDNIEWAKWSWNPVTGCHHGCKYCYARDIAVRFGDKDTPIKDRFNYTVRRNRFDAPFNTKIPQARLAEPGINNVFVCSMADLFGEWVEAEVIVDILATCKETPQWNYIFLTKNPSRLLNFEFPQNSWVGTTVDINSRVKTAMEVMPEVRAPVKFISVEPFLEDLDIDDLSGIDWVIIGGCSESSGGPEVQPQWEWVEKLLFVARDSNCKVYFKPNLKTRPKEYPA